MLHAVLTYAVVWCAGVPESGWQRPRLQPHLLGAQPSLHLSVPGLAAAVRCACWLAVGGWQWVALAGSILPASIWMLLCNCVSCGHSPSAKEAVLAFQLTQYPCKTVSLHQQFCLSPPCTVSTYTGTISGPCATTYRLFKLGSCKPSTSAATVGSVEELAVGKVGRAHCPPLPWRA